MAYMSDDFRFMIITFRLESDMCTPRNWTIEMARDSICSTEVLRQEEKSLEGSSMWKVMMGGQFIYGIGSACVGPFGVRMAEWLNHIMRMSIIDGNLHV